MIPVPETQTGWVGMAKLGFDSMSLGRRILVGAVWTFIVLTALRFIILLISALLERSLEKSIPIKHRPSA